MFRLVNVGFAAPGKKQWLPMICRPLPPKRQAPKCSQRLIWTSTCSVEVRVLFPSAMGLPVTGVPGWQESNSQPLTRAALRENLTANCLPVSGRELAWVHSTPEQFGLYVARREYRNEKQEPEMVARGGGFVVLSLDRLPSGRWGEAHEPQQPTRETCHGSGAWLFFGLPAWSRDRVPGRNARSVPRRQAERIIIPRPNK